MKQQKDFRAWVIYLYALAVAFIFMFFFALNSPIHTFNAHCDYQWYMTVGRSMLSGKVVYRDLFEHKGPLLYVLFMLANLFPHPQLVIWLVEVFCISWFLYFSYRIARKFLSPWLSLAVLPLMMMVLSTNLVRGLEGSCVEEYCLPLFTYGLLCFLDFLLDRKPATWQRSLALGVVIGILFWVKYSMLLFFFVPLIIWLVFNLVEHQWLILIRSGLIMLGGFIIVTVPVVIGFALFNALDDLFKVYFFININSYDGNTADGTNSYITNLSMSLLMSEFYLLTLTWGLICFTAQYWRQNGWTLLITVLITWPLVGLFCGYPYYFLPLFNYALLGVIYAVKVVVYMLQSVELTVKRNLTRVIWTAVVIIISFFVALPLVKNLVEINRPREKYAPLVVADIIADYNHTTGKLASLFCYRMADLGFYNAANIVPNVRYFAENCFTEESFPEEFNAFNETIRNQIADFVVTYRHQYENKKDFLDEYYHPYFGDLDASTIDYSVYEPGQRIDIQVVVLFRNN